MRTSIYLIALAAAVALGNLSLGHAEPTTNHSFIIPATTYDRGNAKIFKNSWADAEPMIGSGGQSPCVAEFDVIIPVAGAYTLAVKYSAQTARPVALAIDGKEHGECCRTATGSWNTSKARWETIGAVPFTQGTHTLKLQRNGAFPHVVSLRFESSEPLPNGWAVQRKEASQKAVVAAKKSAPAPKALQAFTPAGADPAAMRRAIADLISTFGDKYPNGQTWLKELTALEAKQAALTAAGGTNAPGQAEIQQALAGLQKRALLANPLLDFDRLLFVKRNAKTPSLGLPRNWQGNSSLGKKGFNDALCTLTLARPEAEPATFYQPAQDNFVGDVDLNFDADKLLFSSVGTNGRWQVFEIRADGTGLRQLTGEQPDVDSYDPCYLPDGNILFNSTACFIGVPCVYGSAHVANLYRMDANGGHIRQLCFDQEHDWCPTILNNGRVLYTRWEYTDTPHSNTRLLFHMNPDGTGQMEFLGSNSYWPNSFFYARPIPGHPTKVVSIISGHHGDARMGELVVFDPARGRFEESSAVQKIPGYGKPVQRVFRDQLTTGIYPKFLHPYPLSEKYFLVACQPTAQSLWGIYLVDIYDNMVPVKQMPGYALLEPMPFRKTPRPPVIPDRTNPQAKTGLVYIQDIYAGDGLKGIPRGTVKELRVFTYHFAYQGMGGLLGVLGMDGPWDIRRVLGTVPVQADGSVKFNVPANTPISVQPLDSEGKALQLMRSWMTAMPGETVQCAGCHERQNSAPLPRGSLALSRQADEIKPWYGPERGFSYAREVQPVIDRYCVSCHNGQPQGDGKTLCDLRGTEKISDYKSVTPGNGGKHHGGKFSVGYVELQRFVRRPGIESDYHLLEPMEFHADTTQLVQLLKRGHYGVQLDAEGWDRLVTWIDLNCPYHGTWSEELDKPGEQIARRHDLLKLYGGVESNPETVPAKAAYDATPLPKPTVPLVKMEPAPKAAGWPFDTNTAKLRQASGAKGTHMVLDLGEGAVIDLVRIPAGEFIMGSRAGNADEQPLAPVRIPRAFWMASCEVNNRTFARFDPQHDSRVEDKNAYQFGIHGYPANLPEQPVVRVSWHEAMAFCQWLSQRTGLKFNLPTEAQWEYACRAGTETPFNFGDLNADFSKHANFADAKLTEFASNPYTVDEPLKNPTKYDDWIPKDNRFNDGALISVAPGRYQPNAWGLHDMHGNVAEWTRGNYLPYPLNDKTANAQTSDRKVVRGGSWRDLPKDSTASHRQSYLPYQHVFNVGFRVMCEDATAMPARKYAEAR